MVMSNMLHAEKLLSFVKVAIDQKQFDEFPHYGLILESIPCDAVNGVAALKITDNGGREFILKMEPVDSSFREIGHDANGKTKRVPHRFGDTLNEEVNPTEEENLT